MDSLFDPFPPAHTPQQQSAPLTLTQYALLVKKTVADNSELVNRWVMAELSDVRVSGHCYMVLIEKNSAGQTVAKMRATLWRNTYYNVAARFRDKGMELRSGIKVMLRGTASYHEQYGMAFNVTDIDPDYTLGDMERIRREILQRLQAEGVIGMNKQRLMPAVPQRIAVISSAGAAGYGDFMNQLESNPYGLVFYPVLFEAVMQGERTAPTVMDALRRIELLADYFDCVLIIRGGGATTDLNGFDNLELARTVATFVLPVMVGIGHERDNTVLDYIAHTRVKTPTAAAEWLVVHGADMLSRLDRTMREITLTAQSLVSGSREQLAQMETRLHASCSQRLRQAAQQLASLSALLPQLARNRLGTARQQLDNIAARMPQAGETTISLQQRQLEFYERTLRQSVTQRLQQAAMHLDRLEALAGALSPQATLARGYSLTLLNGHAVTDAAQLAPGTVVITRLAKGSVTSAIEAVDTTGNTPSITRNK